MNSARKSKFSTTAVALDSFY